MTLPFLCVFIAFLLIYLPRVLVAVAPAKQPEGLDNNHPRDQQARLQGWGRRANAAHQNAFEGFAPFAASVLVATLGHGDPAWAGGLALAYCLARVAYLGAYLANLGSLRTAIWAIGFFSTIGLFVLPMVLHG